MDYLMDKKEIGKRLKNIRKEKYKTQEAFAEALNLSDRKTVSKWETGETEIPITRLADICRLLDCDLDYLFGKIDVPKNQTNNIMVETGLSENAAEILLTTPHIDTLNALLSDGNFASLLRVISEWSDADLNNTHGNFIIDKMKSKLNGNNNLSQTTINILTVLGEKGHAALYRPIAAEIASKMFDSVTLTLFEEATNNG